MASSYAARPAWAEINLDSIIHNLKQIRQQIGPDPAIMAVVKADGYGHGATAIAEAALEAGASSLAVAFIDEGIVLRQAGLDAPILILGYTDPAQFSALVEYQLTPTTFSLESAQSISRQAEENHLTIPVHLKVDTGMGRIGLLPDEAVEVIAQVMRLPGLQVVGLYTHLAAAEDQDPRYTESQLALFERIIESCRERGISFPLIHAANSAAALTWPAARYNLVRPGLALYGYYPAEHLSSIGPDLVPALTLKSRVVMVKEMPRGSAISYNCTYYTEEDALIATVPIGYADGINRSLSNQGHVLIRGCRVPIVGRICMDHLMVDVTAVPGVRQGDEVVLYGAQGGQSVTIEEAAALASTISYELICAIAKRVPRFYFRDGQLASVQDSIEYCPDR